MLMVSLTAAATPSSTLEGWNTRTGHPTNTRQCTDLGGVLTRTEGSGKELPSLGVGVELQVVRLSYGDRQIPACRRLIYLRPWDRHRARRKINRMLACAARARARWTQVALRGGAGECVRGCGVCSVFVGGGVRVINKPKEALHLLPRLVANFCKAGCKPRGLQGLAACNPRT